MMSVPLVFASRRQTDKGWREMETWTKHLLTPLSLSRRTRVCKGYYYLCRCIERKTSREARGLVHPFCSGPLLLLRAICFALRFEIRPKSSVPLARVRTPYVGWWVGRLVVCNHATRKRRLHLCFSYLC